MTALLTVEDLRVAFPSRHGMTEVVRGVSYSLGRERLGIVGESGSGKSQTGRAILGLTPPPGKMTAKRLSFDGINLLTARPRDWRALRGARMSMVMQDPKYSLNPVMPVGRQLMEMVRAHGDAASARQKSLAMLDAVQIRDPERVFRAFPHELSGGMGQRAMIAMMLVSEPDLLIADEPTSALDVTTQKSVIKMIFDLLDKGIFSTMIFITHELPLLRHVAGRIAIMYAGEIVELGTTDQVIFDPRHPYTSALMGAMLSAEPGQKQKKPVAIEGAPPNLAKPIAGCRFADRCPVVQPDCKSVKQDIRIVGERQVRCAYAK
jgi:peptide/nickel transport system ATP-binding protein